MKYIFRVLWRCGILLFAVHGSFLGVAHAQGAGKPDLMVQTGHFGDIIDLMFSPSGQFVASGSEDNTVKVWDATTGMIIRSFINHKGYITALDMNAAGDMLVSAAKDNTIRLWDLKIGKEIRQLPAHSFYASTVAFSPTNNIIASASIDNTVKLWDIRIGKEIPIPIKHDKPVNTLTFSPDGLSLLTGSDDKTIKILNIPTNTLKTLSDAQAEILSLVYATDGSVFAAQCADKTIIIWDAAKGTVLRKIQGGYGRQIAISPNGRFLASIGEANEDDPTTIVLWNVLNGKKIRTFPGNAPRTLSLAFSPDGNKLLSGGGDRLIRIWDVSSGRETKSLSGYTKVIKSLAFNKQGTILASALSDKEGNNIRTWDIVSGKDPGTLLAPLIQVESITYTQDGATIAAGGTALDNKSIALWNAQTNKLGTLLQADENSVRNITFSPDGKRIASATTDSILQIWDVAQKKVVQQLRGHRRTINNVKFSPDGKMLASASSDRTVKLWDAATGKELKTFAGHTEWVNAVSFSPDGKTLLSGSADRTARLWSIETGKEIRKLEGHKGEILCLSFSPDGKLIATGATDDVVKLWNSADGKETRTLRGHANWITALAFHPESKTLATASADAKVILWDVGKGTEMATLVGIGDMDWAVVTPDGQFDGSEDGTKLLHWVVDGQPVQLDAFFERYYSPKLLSRLFPNSAAALALKAKADAEEKARKEREAKAKREAQERDKREQELLAQRAKQEAEAKLKAETDAKAKKELQDKLVKAEADVKAKKELQDKLAKQEAEAKARREAEAKAKTELAQREAALAAEREAAKQPDVAPGVPSFRPPEVTKEMKLPPLVEILAPRNGDTVAPANGRVNLTFGVKDRGGAINEIRIYQNGKLLFPEEFKGMPSAPGYTLLRDVSIQLIPGKNDFKIIAFNNDRTESNPVESSVLYNAPPMPTKLFIVSIGINTYQNKEYNLRTATSDAKALTKKMEDGGKMYDNVFKYELYDGQATLEKVDAIMKEITAKAQKQDVLAFFYAGHGKALSEGDGAGFYLVLHDVKNINELEKRGLSAKQLAAYFQAIPAGKQLVMFDACQSAAAVDDFVQAKQVKGMARKTGNSILASAGSEEAALEATDLGQGIFTYALLKAMGGDAKNAKGKVTADGLKRYVEEQVPDLARQYLKGREQTPYGQLSGKDFEVVEIKKQ